MEKSLDPNWMTDGQLDFEYKKYILLAYLKKVHNNFNRLRLYPFLKNLIYHYRNLINLKKQKEAIYDSFPEQIRKIDLENLIIEYEKIIDDDDYMEELESIIQFAIPKIKKQVEEGQDIYEFVEDHLSIFPVGLVSLYKDEGYLFLRDGEHNRMNVYEYQITVYENAQEKYRAVRTNYISCYQKTIHKTYEAVKQELVKTYERFVNPATYVIESRKQFPLNETLLPVAKRYLVHYLKAA